MPDLSRIYDELARLSDPSVDSALAAALPTADPQACRRMVSLLLKRAQPEACTSLIVHRHRLEPALQQQVDAQAITLARAIRLAARQRQTRGPANAVRMIRAARAVSLGSLVTEQLRAGDRDLAGHAAECLLTLAHHVAAERGRAAKPAVTPRQAGELLAAVEDAVVHYAAHGQPDALLAMCWLVPSPLPRSAQVLVDANHRAVPPMRALLAAGDHPAARRALVWALTVPTLVEPALAGLRRCCAAGHLGEVLTMAHLTPLSQVRKALSRQAAAGNAAGLWPDPAQIAQMSADQQRGLPRWAAAISGQPGEALSRLAPLARVEDATTRLLALRQLLDLSRRAPGDATEQAIELFIEDADSDIAAIAVWHVLRRPTDRLAALLTRLVNSRHERVRRLAAQRLAPIGFERLWAGWPGLSLTQRLACGRALVKIDPHFHRLLGERLASADRDARLRALSIIGDLRQGSFFTTPLTQLARDSDAYVASAAVAALGSSDGEVAIAALRAALGHGDPRVRSNAVESLDRLGAADHVEALAQLAGRDHHRPRATAIGALMTFQPVDATAALHHMLADPRPPHRAAALWLVEQGGLIDAAPDAAELAVSDPDEPTRRRAERVVHRLIDLMHAPPALQS